MTPAIIPQRLSRRSAPPRLVGLAAVLLLLVLPGRAQETDRRLHPNGEIWRFDAAKIGAEKRPRVLLVGDSILNGYLAAVRQKLEGKAYVDAWVTPLHQASSRVEPELAGVVAHGPYDVIHFNMGLHGWQKGRIPEGKFEFFTRRLVRGLRAGCPHGKMIWASSTPVTTKGRPATLDPEINATIVDHNRRAAAVMAEEGIAVNDLYAVLVDRLELATGDQFHWQKPASELLATQVAAAISAALPASPAPSAASLR
ncbi:SGNH/GDSL hydrolase family protein [Opitutus sp. ER46]|uniref:SGNH/GDSL hydrolase family protein n=1 Tax=Opitutus sp. ER46 TaxID=2161864 RepID=UPI000D303DFA|nr:SGNH/GDSL hydrolase family protein [Opitutus sp. ER46]PTX98399.1 hypothetical protein DB354_03780 [Opitutus sp. ER46]